METWSAWAEAAAAGVLAMAALELVLSADRDRQWIRLAAAAGLAVAYAALVPPPARGLRSGAAFAQLPLLRATAVRPFGSGARCTLWAGLMGLLATTIPKTR